MTKTPGRKSSTELVHLDPQACGLVQLAALEAPGLFSVVSQVQPPTPQLMSRYGVLRAWVHGNFPIPIRLPCLEADGTLVPCDTSSYHASAQFNHV